MTEPTPDADEPAWHKRFAASCNNRAWTLSVQARTAAQDREMLNLAHASAWHWAQVGTELHRMRAQMLLAEVHALLGMGASAIAMAEEMRSYFLGRETEAWELAFTHVIHAHAAYAAHRPEAHRRAYAEAVAAVQAIDDDGDRKIVEETFKHVPPP
jgi:hypothetical protein